MIPRGSTRGILFIALVSCFCLGSILGIIGSLAGWVDEGILPQSVGGLGMAAMLVIRSLLEDEPPRPKTFTAPTDADIEVTVKSKGQGS